MGCNDLCRCWGYVGGRCVRLKYGRCPKDELNLRYYSCECQPPQGQKDSFWKRGFLVNYCDFGGYVFKAFKYNFSYCITYRMTSGILEVFWTLFDALTVGYKT